MNRILGTLLILGAVALAAIAENPNRRSEPTVTPIEYTEPVFEPSEPASGFKPLEESDNQQEAAPETNSPDEPKHKIVRGPFGRKRQVRIK